jgi:steroid 5-alpha reductase family enzyme
MLEPSFLILWTGWAGVFVFMLALWMVQLKTKNAAILDVGWAAGLAGLGFYDALTGPGFGPR